MKKVFIPMSDAALGDNGEVDHQLIPFDPAFLNDVQVVGEGQKPNNWVSDCNSQQARERLFAAHA
jgi:hypothetical protein